VDDEMEEVEEDDDDAGGEGGRRSKRAIKRKQVWDPSEAGPQHDTQMSHEETGAAEEEEAEEEAGARRSVHNRRGDAVGGRCVQLVCTSFRLREFLLRRGRGCTLVLIVDRGLCWCIAAAVAQSALWGVTLLGSRSAPSSD